VHLIADSNCVRREMIEKLGIPAERITTVHLGVRPVFKPLPSAAVLPVLQGLGLRPGYLLHVGTIEPRKNLLRLMQAYCDLPRLLRESHPLALVGGWGWRNEQIREFYESTARHAGVVKLGYVPEEDLPAVYNGARALVFPTHYEGFGFPPLEMMACGEQSSPRRPAPCARSCRPVTRCWTRTTSPPGATPCKPSWPTTTTRPSCAAA